MTTYIAKTFAGRTLAYATHAALKRARARRQDVIVDSWRADAPPPFHQSNNAAAWDEYRTQHGVIGY